MSEPNTPGAPVPPLHCTFCGAAWDSGLFLGCPVPDRPEPNKVPVLCCYLCHVTRTEAELRAQFWENIKGYPRGR